MEKETKSIAETLLSNFLWLTDISNMETLFHKDSPKAEDITVHNDMIKKYEIMKSTKILKLIYIFTFSHFNCFKKE